MTIDTRISRRNIGLFAACQALFVIGTSTMIAEAALVGNMLADDKALATLPVAVQQLFTLLTSFPASLLMRRIGRRAGFSLGALFGIAGTSVATLGVIENSFWVFCAGAALNGVYSGFSQFYRFAAVDGAVPAWRSRAISFTLAGGVIAALVGPELAKLTKDLMAPILFAGSFASLIGVAILALCVLQFVQIPPPGAEERGEGRPLGEIMRQPVFMVAALGGMVGYAGMSFVMTVTPLAMAACQLPFESAAMVIQWHVLAMFGPSFITGTLIARYGVLNIMTIGALLFAAAIAVNLSGVDIMQFLIGLILVGLAWNFLYVGATTLLTEAYRPAEKAKTQAANDVMMFSGVTLAAFSSGAIHNWVGWAPLNLIVAPFIVAVLAALIALRLARRPRPAPA